MRKGIALVFFYNKHNRYGFNSLAGTLESVESFSIIKIYFIYHEDELILGLKTILKRHEGIFSIGGKD